MFLLPKQFLDLGEERAVVYNVGSFMLYVLCTVDNIIDCLLDSNLHFYYIFQAFDSTPFGIDLPKLEERLPTKEL
jgi:hypothetical protein